MLLSCQAWAQESFNINAQMVSPEGYIIPGEVQFIFNNRSNTLKVLSENHNFHLPLKFQFEKHTEDNKFYLYVFSGDPKSPQYKSLPGISFYFDKKNGKVTYIKLDHYDVINEKPAEPLQFITDFGLEYIQTLE